MSPCRWFPHRRRIRGSPTPGDRLRTARIVMHPAHHAPRHGVEEQCRSRQRDRVAAEVHQAAASHRRIVTDIGRVVAVKRKQCVDGSQPADPLAGDQFLRFPPLRMVAIHERLHHLQARMPPARFAQLPGFIRRQRDRLFAQHVLPGLKRTDRPGHVLIVRQRNVDRVDRRIEQQGFVGFVEPRNAQAAGRIAGLVGRARGNGDDFAMLPALHGRDHFRDADLGGAQNSPADFFHGCDCADRGTHSVPLASEVCQWRPAGESQCPK